MVLRSAYIMGLCKMHWAQQTNITLASGKGGVQTRLVEPQVGATQSGTSLQD